jgi:hypothetical protein
MKKFLISILIIIIVLMLLPGCSTSESTIKDEENGKISKMEKEISSKTKEIEKLKKEISNLQEELHSKDVNINYLTEEIDYYRSVIDSLIEDATEEKLLEIAKSEVLYALKVRYGTRDNRSDETIVVPKNGRLTLEKGDFFLILSEYLTPYNIIRHDNEIHKQVRISDYIKHIEVTNFENHEVLHSSGTVVDAIHFGFENVQSGTEIEFKITDRLRDRLGLETNKIILKVK